MTALLGTFSINYYYLNPLVLLLSKRSNLYRVHCSTMYGVLSSRRPRAIAMFPGSNFHSSAGSFRIPDLGLKHAPSNAYNNLMPIADRSILRPNYWVYCGMDPSLLLQIWYPIRYISVITECFSTVAERCKRVHRSRRHENVDAWHISPPSPLISRDVTRDLFKYKTKYTEFRFQFPFLVS